MTSQRQHAFQKLRPPCVQLSSVALQFKADQVSVKQVLHALKTDRDVLYSLGEENVLDEKLAEYAFFPLSHVFNESRRLSSACLEVAIQCVQTLVSKGWRQQLVPEMGKQLLLLMSLLAGGDPKKPKDQPSDELKAASFDCIGVIFQTLRTSQHGQNLFGNAATKSVIDQLVYVILESIENSVSDLTQISAANAMLELDLAISDQAMLASLLPRTVSSLTKSLRPSTQVRRTQKVLITYLNLVTAFLRSVLADHVISTSKSSSSEKEQSKSTTEVLDESWLRATAPQVKTALIHIVKLRNHEAPNVLQALMDLCVMVVEECSHSLEDSLPIMVEIMISIAQSGHDGKWLDLLKHLVMSRPEVADILKAKFYDWSQTLPRMMLGHDEKPKQQMLGLFATSFTLIVDHQENMRQFASSLAKTLLDSVSAAESLNPRKVEQLEVITTKHLTALSTKAMEFRDGFSSVVLSHGSQSESLTELQRLINVVNEPGSGNSITRYLVDSIPEADLNRQVSAIWLALTFLRQSTNAIDVNDMINVEPSSEELMLSRPFLVSDLYAFTLPFLLNSSNSFGQQSSDWRLTALALECLVLQAEQLGTSYRSELVETLYPLLSLLGSRNFQLQNHAITALNLLAKACQYHSTSQMLVGNVDYLVNSISMKLNGFDVSPQAPQVLLMMVRLCGAQLTPYLDDVIASIFGAIDNFHGYPQLVEVLFEALRVIVEENTKDNIAMAITGRDTPRHQKEMGSVSTLHDIIQDLRTKKSRKRKAEQEDEEILKAPKSPWTSEVDGLGRDAPDDEDMSEDNDAMSSSPQKNDGDSSLSKSHTLLLKIARATTPHLASPSAQVRHTLLQLLNQISPLLARNENSFLPLINAIWPAIIPRLLSLSDADPETTYNACAAAQLMSKFCEGAGDFMATRIEEIFPSLESLFRSTSARVTKINTDTGATRLMLQNEVNSSTADIISLGSSKTMQSSTRSDSVQGTTRTTERRLINALVDLFISIISNVRLTDDNGDKVVSMLVPLIREAGGERIHKALNDYNADALWLMEQDIGH